MSAEGWNILIAGATFLVIAASAFGALAQLRHLNTSNQLNSLLFFLKLLRDRELQDDRRFLHADYPTLARDPGFLASLDAAHVDKTLHRELRVCGWYEEVGALLKHGLINERAFLDMVCPATILRDWRAAEPTLSILRKRSGSTSYMNFEYLVARSKKMMAEFPDGIYPADTQRLTWEPRDQTAYGRSNSVVD